MPHATLRDLDLEGKRVLVREDFNVPRDKQSGAITDTTRLEAALPTIRLLLERGAAVILLSHLGRPDGQPDPKYSLAPVAEALSKLLGQPVRFVPDTVGEQARVAAAQIKPGEVVLLENVRFYRGEEENDPQFARSLASLATCTSTTPSGPRTAPTPPPPAWPPTCRPRPGC